VMAEKNALGRNRLPFRSLARRYLARVSAVRIVRAADEGAELADLERQLTVAAGRALTRISSLGAWWKDMGCQNFIQRVENIGDAQLLRGLNGGDEIPPEIAQNFLPIDLAR